MLNSKVACKKKKGIETKKGERRKSESVKTISATFRFPTPHTVHLQKLRI